MQRRDLLKWFLRIAGGYVVVSVSPLTRINTTLFGQASGACVNPMLCGAQDCCTTQDNCGTGDTTGHTCSQKDICDVDASKDCTNDECTADSSGTCNGDRCVSDSSGDCTNDGGPATGCTTCDLDMCSTCDADSSCTLCDTDTCTECDADTCGDDTSGYCVSDKSGPCTNDSCVSDKSGGCISDRCTSDSSKGCTNDLCRSDSSGECNSDTCRSDSSGDCVTDECTADSSGGCENDHCIADASGYCKSDSCVADSSGGCEKDNCLSDKSGECNDDSCVSDKSGPCTNDNCRSDSSGACEDDRCISDSSGACKKDVCILDFSSSCTSDVCREDRSPSDCTSDTCSLDLALNHNFSRRHLAKAGINQAIKWLYRLSVIVLSIALVHGASHAATVIDATNAVFLPNPTYMTSQVVSVPSPVGPFLRDCDGDGILEADTNGDGQCAGDPEVKDYNGDGTKELPPGTPFSGSFQFTCIYIPSDVAIVATGPLTIRASQEVAIFGAMKLIAGAEISSPAKIDLRTSAWLSETASITFVTALTGEVDETQTGLENSVPPIAYNTICPQQQPPQPTVAVPTMNEWGLIILMVLTGGGAVYWLRRAGG